MDATLGLSEPELERFSPEWWDRAQARARAASPEYAERQRAHRVARWRAEREWRYRSGARFEWEGPLPADRAETLARLDPYRDYEPGWAAVHGAVYPPGTPLTIDQEAASSRGLVAAGLPPRPRAVRLPDGSVAVEYTAADGTVTRRPVALLEEDHEMDEYESALAAAEADELREYDRALDLEGWRIVLRALPETEEPLPGRLASDIRANVSPEPHWYVPGVIVRGWSHKFAGREKIGKGTFVAYLLGCLERCEPTIFGDAYPEPVTAVVLTEEPEDSLREKLDNANVEQARIIDARMLSGLSWPERVSLLVRVARSEGHGIVYVENISRAAGVEDESGVELARREEVLADACTSFGLTLIVDHHHRKGSGRVEDMSRGGTGLAGAIDVNIEMLRVGKSWTDRRRRLFSRGRVSATIWERTAELAEDGRSYIEPLPFAEEDVAPVAPDTPLAKARADWRLLLDAGRPLTVAEFEEAADCSRSTASRRLNALVEDRLASVETVERPGGGKPLNVYVATPPDSNAQGS